MLIRSFLETFGEVWNLKYRYEGRAQLKTTEMAKRALMKMQNSSEAGIIPHKNEIIKYHVELWYNKGHEKGQVTFYSVHEIDKIGFVNAEAKNRR